MAALIETKFFNSSLLSYDFNIPFYDKSCVFHGIWLFNFSKVWRLKLFGWIVHAYHNVTESDNRSSDQSSLQSTAVSVTADRNESISITSKSSALFRHFSACNSSKFSIYQSEKSINFVVSSNLFDGIVGIFQFQSEYHHGIWKFDKYLLHIHCNHYFFFIGRCENRGHTRVNRKIRCIFSNKHQEFQLSIGIFASYSSN